MRNIPEALRREVWDLVDTRRRLWREMFSLWRKHPPGWWWSLDRPGDLRRALVRLVLNVTVSLLIIAAGVSVFGGIVVVEENAMYFANANDSSRTPLSTTMTYRREPKPITRSSGSPESFSFRRRPVDGAGTGTGWSSGSPG